MPAPGEGRIRCQQTARRLHQTIESAYPLKIISPQAIPNSGGSPRNGLVPAVSYILTYGGGIVHGDQIHVTVQVGQGCGLMLLTQGSTKVFHRSTKGQQRLSYLTNEKLDAIAMHGKDQSYQTLLVDVEDGALCCLLPDPVTCFRGAMYNQRQAIRLHDPGTSSLVLLDWMTSGRMSRGERWDFDKYFSVNIVSVLSPGTLPPMSQDQWMADSRIIIRDALLLGSQNTHVPWYRRLESIDVFAYLLVLGPAVAPIAERFRAQHRDHRIRPFRPTDGTGVGDEGDVVWSVSEIDELGVKGVAVRIAGPDTETVKSWIKRRLDPIRFILGESAWSMYYNA
ncbi:hypothetical protein EV175_001675 [Coemansia sp. RSA 1933]|nr:hypothetical protein EV175_001675 [Coemansia sp. RSA 1933]